MIKRYACRHPCELDHFLSFNEGKERQEPCQEPQLKKDQRGIMGLQFMVLVFGRPHHKSSLNQEILMAPLVLFLEKALRPKAVSHKEFLIQRLALMGRPYINKI